MLDVTKLSLLIKSSQKHFSLELSFLINIWKILVPEIFLSIKEKGTFAFAKGITDNRKLWKTIKQNFTDKTLKDERITLVNGTSLKPIKKMQLKKYIKDDFEKIVKTSKTYRQMLSDLSNDSAFKAGLSRLRKFSPN